jgi:hypothetical protein
MRRARGHSTTHWFVIALAVAYSWLLAPAARPSVPGPQQSSASSGTTAKKKTRKRHTKREPSQKAPTPDRISEIQSALARNGYYQGQPNGKWDANTINAMQRFQSDNGIDPSGKLNAPSLQKLGLGSSTAGVSAPKPVSTTPSATTPSGGAPATATPAPVAASPAPSSTATSSSTAGSSAGAGTSGSSSAAPQSASSAPRPPQP